MYTTRNRIVTVSIRKKKKKSYNFENSHQLFWDGGGGGGGGEGGGGASEWKKNLHNVGWVVCVPTDAFAMGGPFSSSSFFLHGRFLSQLLKEGKG